MSAAPLHSIDAEQAVLGALLDDNSLAETIPTLRPHHFHEPLHEKLYADCLEMIQAGRLADPRTLRNLYAGRFEEIGGAGYLLTLVENGARIRAQAIEYAGLIERLWAGRQIRRALENGLHDLSRGFDPSAVVADVEGQIRALGGANDAAAVNYGDAMEMAEAQLDSDQPRGLATGWRDIDIRLGGFFPGNLVLVAGRPGMGKSSFASNLARGWAFRGLKGHFASYEMSALELGERAIGAMAGVEYSALRRTPERIDRSRVREAVRNAPRSVTIDATPAQTVSQLEMAARQTRRRHGGLDFVIVDYLQLMKTPTPHPSLVSKITEISQDLKAMAKRLDVPVVALSQMSRASEGRGDRDRRPQLSDLRDSGSLEQDADVVIGLYRPEYYLAREEPTDDADVAEWRSKMERVKGLLEVVTLKQRQGPTGVDILSAHLESDQILDRVPVQWRGRA